MKRKSTAVWLSIFFGMFTWLYTYKEDRWKFWCCLIMSIVTGGVWLLPSYIWALIDVVSKSSTWYGEFEARIKTYGEQNETS